jgi:catechol 2,3-dioxygenase-like lactoylglutathione lyase family enzyme
VTASNLFHVGVLVPDLGEAMQRFEDVLGLEFKDPARVQVNRFVEGQFDGPIELNLTWSVQGPPYLELIESTGDALYAHHHEGLHHIGLWEPDNAGRRDSLQSKGVGVTSAQFYPEGGIIALYSEPNDRFGTRMEFVDEARREQMETWLAGGEWVD